jgi:hypothetical protein
MAFQWFDYECTGWLSNGLIMSTGWLSNALIMSVPDGFPMVDYERTGWFSNGLIMSVPDGFPMVDYERTGWLSNGLIMSDFISYMTKINVIQNLLFLL